MAIKSVVLKEFSAFTNLSLQFSPGINVFIGANATGKSHLLKVLYCIHRCLEGTAPETAAATLRTKLREKLQNVFRPDNAGRLVHRRHGVNSGRVVLEIDQGRATFHITTHDKIRTGARLDRPLDERSSLFIPSRETFAIFEGFRSLYEEYDLKFDETYYDLCQLLGRPTLRGPRGAKAARLIAPLEVALGGKVVLDGERFYLKGPGGKIEAHLVSEGLRKIATLARLITNGSLSNKGVLFWDEPEANLNPKLACELIEFLRHLAQQDVQIFLATHDTLVAQRLSLASEYEIKPQVPTRFFSLHKDANGKVLADSGAVLSDLQHNPMLEEFTRFHEEERKAFEASLDHDGTRI